ncbi:MAG: hypothetical protein M3463_19250, partial [Verrucomicrobiota bacterium]|nr:hypothetical protein [Verrucomicrobiota bacterium]
VTSAQPPPFIVEFPRGSIELLAVAEHPSTGGLGWRMDGLPALEGPFVNEGSKTHPDASQWAREFVFRTRDLPVDASPLRFEFEGSAALVGRGAPAAGSAPGQSLANHHLIVATFPRIQRVASIRVGAAFGPWRTLTQSTGVGSFGKTVRHERVEWKIAHGTPIESKDGRTIVSCTASEYPDWEGRLVALTRDGKEVTASRVWMLNQQSDWSFADLPLGTVREFRFQVRPRHWVEFRGIQLVPAAQQP